MLLLRIGFDFLSVGFDGGSEEAGMVPWFFVGCRPYRGIESDARSQ